MKVDARGNGLIISSKVLDLLKAQPISKNRGIQVKVVDSAQSESKPSDKQLQYAQSLGIIVLPDMTFEEVSDQINCSMERDLPAQDIFKKIANANGVPCSAIQVVKI